MNTDAPLPVDEPAVRRLAEAAAWRVHLTEAGVDSSEAFEAWLVTDPANTAAWRQVQKPWQFVGDHATAPELMTARRDALERARRHGHRRWGVRAPGLARRVAVAAVLVIVGAGAFYWNTQRPDVYRTALGERRVVPLEDGSKISLDSGSDVRVRYTADARRLELRTGQARFDVVHDAQRPFSVRARDKLVIATGTAFNVDLLGAKVLVTLIEGRVEVLESANTSGPLRAAPSGAKPAPAPQRQVLTAGEQLIVTPQSAPVVAKVDLQRATAWESGQLVFADEPLSAVAERVSRYTDRPLQVDAAAGALRISGVFKAGDVDTFVDTVTRYLPVAATPREDGGITLHSKG